MPKKIASIEEIANYFSGLPRSTGTAEERVAVTAKHFQVKPQTVKNHLKFWWPGPKFLKEFATDGRRGQVRWDRPTAELVKAMNLHRTVAQAAKALQTTSMTLTKALRRHGIEQRWVVEK